MCFLGGGNLENVGKSVGNTLNNTVLKRIDHQPSPS